MDLDNVFKFSDLNNHLKSPFRQKGNQQMKKVSAIFILMISFVLWACKKGSDNFNSSTTLFNAAIGMPPISIFLNGTAAISNDTFGVFKTNARITASTYNVAFVTTLASGVVDTIYRTVTSFPSGITFSAIVYDSLGGTTAPILYYNPDNFPATVADGKCSIRFFNLIPNSSYIYLVNDTGTNTAGKVFLSRRTFGDFGSNNAFAEYDTTSSKLRILNDTAVSTSTVRFDSTSVRLDSFSTGFKNGKIYSLYLTGTYRGTGILKPKLIVVQNN